MVVGELANIIELIRTHRSDTEEKDVLLRALIAALCSDDSTCRRDAMEQLVDYMESDVLQDRFALHRRAGITLLGWLCEAKCFAQNQDSEVLTRLLMMLSNQMSDWHAVSGGLIPIVTSCLEVLAEHPTSLKAPIPLWLRNPWKESMTYRTRADPNDAPAVIDVADLVGGSSTIENSKENKFLMIDVSSTDADGVPLSVIIISSLYIFVSGAQYAPALRLQLYELLDMGYTHFAQDLGTYLGPRCVTETLVQMSDESHPVNLFACFKLLSKIRSLLPQCFMQETELPSMPKMPRVELSSPTQASPSEETALDDVVSQDKSGGQLKWKHGEELSNFLFSVMPFAGTQMARSLADFKEVTYGALLDALSEVWLSWEERLIPAYIDIVFDQLVTISEKLEGGEARNQALQDQLLELTKLTMLIVRGLRDIKLFRYILIPLIELSKLCLWTARPSSILFEVFHWLTKSVLKSLGYKLYESANKQWFPPSIDEVFLSDFTTQSLKAPMRATDSTVLTMSPSGTDLIVREIVTDDHTTCSTVNSSGPRPEKDDEPKISTPATQVQDDDHDHANILALQIFNLTKSVVDLLRTQHRTLLPPHPRSSFWLTLQELLSAISAATPLGSVASLTSGVKYVCTLFNEELELVGHGLADEVPASRINLINTLIWNLLVKLAACKAGEINAHNCNFPWPLLQDISREVYQSIQSVVDDADILNKLKSITALERPVERLELALSMWKGFQGHEAPAYTNRSFFSLPFETLYVTYYLDSRMGPQGLSELLEKESGEVFAIINTCQPDAFFDWAAKSEEVYSIFLDHFDTSVLRQNEGVSDITRDCLDTALTLMMFATRQATPCHDFNQTLSDFEASLPSFDLYPSRELPLTIMKAEKRVLQHIDRLNPSECLSPYAKEALKCLAKMRFSDVQFIQDFAASDQAESPKALLSPLVNLSEEERVVEAINSGSRSDMQGVIDALGLAVSIEYYLKLRSVTVFGKVSVPFMPEREIAEQSLNIMLDLLQTQALGDDLNILNIKLDPAELADDDNVSAALKVVYWTLYLDSLRERLTQLDIPMDRDHVVQIIQAFHDFYQSQHFSQWHLFYIQRCCLVVVDLVFLLFPGGIKNSIPMKPLDTDEGADEAIDFLNNIMYPLIEKVESLARVYHSNEVARWPRVIRDLQSLRQCTLQDVKLRAAEMYTEAQKQKN